MHYVYKHVHPETGGVFYVGRGQAQRAWMTHRVHRGEGQHLAVINSLLAAGYIPSDWVIITHRGLSADEAKSVEAEQITTLREAGAPLCNSVFGTWSKRLTEEEEGKAADLRERGMSLRAIADHLGVSTMTIHLTLSRKTKTT
jgi:DNA-binding NarL/FixJ family response regulator